MNYDISGEPEKTQSLRESKTILTPYKITVSIEKPVVDNAKLALLKKGKTMNDYIERSLRALSTSEILNDLCEDLNLNCKYVASEQMERQRPDLTGKVLSEMEVRGMRNERNSSLY